MKSYRLLNHQQTGFSLIELLIVIVIIGVLAGIAVPSYIEHIQRAKRSDAKTALLNVQVLQETYRTNNPIYGTLAQIGAAATSSDGYYTIAVLGGGSAPTATSYTATAAPVAGGDQAGDACGTFAINANGHDTTGSYASEDCWDN